MTGIRESIEARSAELAEGEKGYIRQRGINTGDEPFGEEEALRERVLHSARVSLVAFLAREWVFRYQEGKQPYGMCITDNVGSISVFLGFS